jgi:cytochrome P450
VITATDDLYYDPVSLEVNRDPYPIYRRLRDEAPLYYNERYDFWALSRFADVFDARFDWRAFRSGGGVLFERMLDPALPKLPIMEMDPPEHRQNRKIITKDFANSSVNALTPFVEEICAEFLAPYEGSEGFDFVEVLARKIPMMVVCQLLGIERADQEVLRPLFEARQDALAKPKDKPDVAEAVAKEREIVAYLLDIASDRRAHPRDDLMTTIVQAAREEPDGSRRPLTAAELGEFALLLFNGGNSTTTATLSMVTLLLGRHRDQLRLLRENRSLIDNVIEEAMRFDPVSQSAGRHSTVDLTYYGVTVPAGSRFILLNGAASRDEREYENPDVFDITKGGRRHMGFGWGLHACIGAALARLEVRIGLSALLDLFPDWSVDEDGVRYWLTTTLRGYTALPIVFAR